jgi:HD-GYP domain-containing protein (c-di-GMP phosphodiesterase class II)
MQKHTTKGAEILQPIAEMQPIIPIVRNHHERWDGTGYPNRLRGEQIPLATRLFAVADSLDAMTSDRPYRRGIALEEAMAEVVRNRGTQFDPAAVDALLSLDKALVSQLLQLDRAQAGRLSLV